MDLTDLSNQQLAERLRQLQQPGETSQQAMDRLQETVHELQVHRVELEMQNRALCETQAELEQSVRRFADLYDHLPVGYVTVSVTGHVLQANLAAVSLLQQERPRLVGMHLRKFLDPYDSGRLAAHLENCVATGRESTLEVTLRFREGTTIAVQFSSRIAPVPTDGDRTIHIAITDISKLKHTQRVLEDINREQEAFNYSISHDLRAPLVTITKYASIVISDYGATLEPDCRSMVERMQSAAVRLEETLKHLLEYSTLGREEIVLEKVEVEQVIADLLIEHRAVIESSSAVITVEAPLPPVRACAAILSRVLANLLTNALKYTEAGQAPHVRFAAEHVNGRVVLKVIDRGIGIDRKYHERIFNVFERLHGYSRYPGSGVGLAICRRAVDRMNGRIWCKSEPGAGSTFCVELAQA